MRQIPALVREKRLLLAAIALAIGVILLGWTYIGGRTSAESDADMPMLANDQTALVDDLPSDLAATSDQQPQVNPTPAEAFAVVYISGAVRHPDVYQVPAAARMKDVVVAAGGLADDAAADRINLAEHVVDAQHIHIPRQGEEQPEPAISDDSAPAGEQAALVDINTASAADLDGLPGIGQSIAQRIVEYRTANGPFQAIEDLRKVKGIGPALFAKITPLIAVGP
jgi:competence protein ComEA